MKFRQLAVTFPGFALGVLALTTAPVPAVHAEDARVQNASAQHSGAERRKLNELVKIVQQNTARFKDAAAAEAEGYHLMFGCVSGEDYGAMGLHYVNLELAFDGGKLDATKPEIVIYEPTPSGRPRLIGADYLVIAEDWHKDPNHKSAPELNGQKFHYFGAPNRFGLNAFYTLHVWAWKDNPTGTFANWHQNVSCDSHDGPNQ
jgi:hypothetical protein